MDKLGFRNVGHEELHVRRKLYDSGKEILTNELSAEAYLDRLTRNERNGLVYIFDCLKYFQRCSSPAVLAVGTTTFPASYWERLKKMFSEHDPDKMHFAERQGEDIDILFCGGDVLGLHPESDEILQRDLSKAGIPFETYTYEEGRVDGTFYQVVPEDYREQEGQNVIRSKEGKVYGENNYKIQFEGCRPFHLFFRKGYEPLDMKLKSERINGGYFSLLCRSLLDFPMIVGRINNSPTLFKPECEINEDLEQKASKKIESLRRFREWLEVSIIERLEEEMSGRVKIYPKRPKGEEAF